MASSLRVALALLLVTFAYLVKPAIASAAVGPVTVDVTAPSSAQAGVPFDVVLHATNGGSSLGTWSLSVALPDGGDVVLVAPTPFTSAQSYARVFLPGDSLYSFVQRKSIAADYPLAELYEKQAWPAGSQKTLSVSVTPPAEATSMRLYLRVAAAESNGTVISFAQPGSETDQQGLNVLVRTVTVTPGPSAAPAAPKSPTAAPRPSPTPTSARASTTTPKSTPTTAPNVGPVSPATPTATFPASTPTPLPTGIAGRDPVVNLLLTLAALLVIAGLVTLLNTRRSRQSHAPAARRAERASVGAVRKQAIAGPQASAAPRHDLSETSSFRMPVAGTAGAQTIALPPFPPGLAPIGEVKRGGMADVYRAYQPALDRYVAVKMPKPGFAADPGFAARFRDEARRTARLNHQNIVTVYDVGEVAGTPYISMRYVDGPSLSELMAAAPGSLPARRALGILEQIALALDYAHSQGVIHGDVKPSNVLVDYDDRVTLTDFGIARVVGTDATTQAVAFGTPDYISPEQARGEATGPASDVYSLGVVAYQLLVGRKPFNADNPLALVYAHAYSPPPSPDQLNPRLSPEVSQALLRALAKDPARRYSTASELVAALRQEMRPKA